MEFSLLLKGAIIGFSLAMAVGPIGLLCIHNSLTKGFRAGFASGLGAALADSLYGAIGGFGVAAITHLLLSHKMALQLVGGLVLCYLGSRMFLKKKPLDTVSTHKEGLWSLFATTFLLTLTNPVTILAFIAIFASLGIVGGENPTLAALMIVSGIFIGSALCYTLLCAISASFKQTLTPSGMFWLHRVSGFLITGFGILALASAIRALY